MHASTSGAGGGKRISQNEFTEKAWQAVVAAPDIAKQYQQQIVVRCKTLCMTGSPALVHFSGGISPAANTGGLLQVDAALWPPTAALAVTVFPTDTCEETM